MSSFEVKVYPIELHPHENADALEIGRIPGQDYQFVVRKGQFVDGDLFVYIPEQAVLPQDLIEGMGLTGMLHGSNKNRVKPIRLRGVLSQGLAHRPVVWPPDWELGMDVGDELGITKYEPVVPTHLEGRVKPAPNLPRAPGGSLFQGYTDIDNIKKFRDVLQPGELVYVTEKLHGTCLLVGSLCGERVVSSLGLARRGYMLEDDGNVYWETAKRYELHDKLEMMLKSKGCQQGMIFGEIIGVQDLKYGHTDGQTSFQAFDLLLEESYGYQPYYEFLPRCLSYGIPTVPLLFIGPYAPDHILSLTAGSSSLADVRHVREGVVIRPAAERRHPALGRVILKSINPDYLTRKNGSEFH